MRSGEDFRGHLDFIIQVAWDGRCFDVGLGALYPALWSKEKKIRLLHIP